MAFSQTSKALSELFATSNMQYFHMVILEIFKMSQRPVSIYFLISDEKIANFIFEMFNIAFMKRSM